MILIFPTLILISRLISFCDSTEFYFMSDWLGLLAILEGKTISTLLGEFWLGGGTVVGSFAGVFSAIVLDAEVVWLGIFEAVWVG